jgi:hypothetical protein
VDIIPVRIATSTGSEDALLCAVEGVVYALLVPVAKNGGQAWFLHTGFGCCEQEGLIFDTLDDASRWIAECRA